MNITMVNLQVDHAYVYAYNLYKREFCVEDIEIHQLASNA